MANPACGDRGNERDRRGISQSEIRTDKDASYYFGITSHRESRPLAQVCYR